MRRKPVFFEETHLDHIFPMAIDPEPFLSQSFLLEANLLVDMQGADVSGGDVEFDLVSAESLEAVFSCPLQ